MRKELLSSSPSAETKETGKSATMGESKGELQLVTGEGSVYVRFPDKEEQEVKPCGCSCSPLANLGNALSSCFFGLFNAIKDSRCCVPKSDSEDESLPGSTPLMQ